MTPEVPDGNEAAFLLERDRESSVERRSECMIPLRIRTIITEPTEQLSEANSLANRVFLVQERESNFHMIVYREKATRRDHVIVMKDLGDDRTEVPTRIHSSCLISDTFNSSKCDCNEQVHIALDIVDQKDRGIVIWLDQPGMNNGLDAEIAQIDSEAKTGSYDPVIYNGEPFVDRRTYEVAADILKDLGVTSIQLITNSLTKKNEMEKAGIVVTTRIPCIAPTMTAEAASYLEDRRVRGGYFENEETTE